MYDDPPQTVNSLQCKHDIPLYALNYLPGCQNVHVENLEGFNRFCGSKTWFSEQLQAFGVVKTGLHRPSTDFLAVKTLWLTCTVIQQALCSQNQF